MLSCYDRNEIVPPFLKLLRDSEAEVRVAAAGKVAAISNLLDADTVSRHFVLSTSQIGESMHPFSHCNIRLDCMFR